MIEMLLTKGSKRRKGKKLTRFTGVTIHNTGNTSKGANAKKNAQYQKNTENSAAVGWHITVDENETYLSIPIDEIAEHCGKRLGNDTTIGIEICDHSDGELLKATDNAVKVTADIFRQHGIATAVHGQNIFMHKDWSGKYCPQDILNGKPYSFDVFVAKVNEQLEGTAFQKQQQEYRLLKLTKPYMRGEDVKLVQTKVGATADSIYGPKTKEAVIAFQKKQGLIADGIVGKNTWSTLI